MEIDILGPVGVVVGSKVVVVGSNDGYTKMCISISLMVETLFQIWTERSTNSGTSWKTANTVTWAKFLICMVLIKCCCVRIIGLQLNESFNGCNVLYIPFIIKIMIELRVHGVFIICFTSLFQYLFFNDEQYELRVLEIHVCLFI